MGKWENGEMGKWEMVKWGNGKWKIENRKWKIGDMGIGNLTASERPVSL